MVPRQYILVVNGRKVRQPVFVIGAPHSGVDLLARALKRSPGFHLTIGQPSVLEVVLPFALRPSSWRGRDAAAVAKVLRDAFAQAWQVAPHACMTCLPECRAAVAHWATGTCVDERLLTRYADASPELMYCAEMLVEAFGDARIVQIIRDGRDVVSAMLVDPAEQNVIRRADAAIAAELPHPFYGISTEDDRAIWPNLSAAGKSALRWRGAVDKMAQLRTALTPTQLTTFRYEDVIRDPHSAGTALSAFIDAKIHRIERVPPPSNWRQTLTPAQILEIGQVAGDHLRRVGYAD